MSEWIPCDFTSMIGITFHNQRCSNCGQTFNEKYNADIFKYCPMYGAKMDEEVEEKK